MGGSHYTVDDDVAIDTKAILGALWKAKGWIVPIVAVAGIGTYLALSIVSPKYRADSQVLIESARSVFEENGQQETERARLDQQGVGSQVQLITSRDLARRVAKRLDLASNPEFDAVGAGGGSIVGDVLALLGIAGDRSRLSPEERILESYYKALSVYPVKDSRVISVEFQSKNPQLAADAANAIVEEYLALQAGVKRAVTVNRVEILAPEIKRLQEQVKEAERAVESYRSSNDLLLGANNIPLAQQQLAELNTQLSTARSARSEASAKMEIVKDLLKSGKSINTASDVLDSQLIQRLRERQVALRARIAELMTTLMANHPQVRSLRSQLDDYDKQITAEVRKVLKGLENDVRVANARVESLTANLNELKVSASRANEQQVRLRELERDAEIKSTQLATLLSRYGEADATRNAAILPADARIISRAIAPLKPFWPKKLPITIAVTVAVFLICAAIVIGREFIAGRATRRETMVFTAPDQAEPPLEAAPAATENATPELAETGKVPPMAAGYAAANDRVDDLTPKPESAPAAPFQVDPAAARRDPIETAQQAEMSNQPVSGPEPRVPYQPPQEASQHAGFQAAPPPPHQGVPQRQSEAPFQTQAALQPQPTVPTQPMPAAHSPMSYQPRPAYPAMVPPATGSGLQSPAAYQPTMDAGAMPAFGAHAPQSHARPIPAAGGAVMSGPSMWAALRGDGRPIKTIVVASALNYDLAGAAASQLAQAAAVEGRVVMVDLKGPPGANGIADLVSGRVGFTEAITRLPGSRAHRIMPGSHPVALHGEGVARFETVLTALMHTYDWVILTIGGLSPDSITASVLNRADAVVLAAPASGAEDATYMAFDTLADGTSAGVHIFNVDSHATRSAA